MLKQHFTLSRTVELCTEGVSKVVLMLESIGGSKIDRTSMFAKLQKLGMCCVTVLGVFNLVSRFSRHSICRFC